VAALFPARPELEERELTVVPVDVPGLAPLVPRISLSLPVINAARSIIFLVTGAGKAEAVAHAMAGPASGVPAGLVEPDDGSVLWILDAAAAELLDDEAARA
jgi:6-phosphogluconolactonase